MAVTIVDTSRPVTGGVDTHLEVNVAAVLDGIGGLVGVESFPTSPEGNERLLEWMASFGPVSKVGVEGTGSYGASLARFLREARVEVMEVDRPNRQERRRKGKNDVVDAIEAARAAQGQRQLGAPKTRDGNGEAIRALMVAKRSARDQKIAALNQIRHLGFTAPEEIRQSLKGVSRRLIAKRAAAMHHRGSARHGPGEMVRANCASLAGRGSGCQSERRARLTGGQEIVPVASAEGSWSPGGRTVDVDSGPQRTVACLAKVSSASRR